MTDADQPAVPPPADPDMAAKLAINRTGRLTSPQRRLALLVGLGAFVVLLCPLSILLQVMLVLLAGDLPIPTVSGVIFTVIGVLFVLMYVGLIGSNVATFLPEAFMRRPVRFARGPLRVRVPERERPELPFSYLIGDYSFAPYVAPEGVPLRVGAPYIVYYAARSRLLLSLAALDAPDADQWKPAFKP